MLKSAVPQHSLSYAEPMRGGVSGYPISDSSKKDCVQGKYRYMPAQGNYARACMLPQYKNVKDEAV